MKLHWRPGPGIKRVRSKLDALRLDDRDMAGPVLVVLGTVHRRQQSDAFVSEGATTAGGRWAALNPLYAARKAKAGGKRKVLQLSGDMKARFISRANRSYIQRFIPRGGGRGIFQFGAHSDVAAAHRAGAPALAPRQSPQAKRAFGGRAPRMPVRDMLTKTPAQIAEFAVAFKRWYIEKRVPQVLRSGRR